MTGFETASIHDALSDRLGESLRGVVCYDGVDIDYVLRDDVAELYRPSDVRAFVDDSIVHQLGDTDMEQAFELGDLEAVIRQFEVSWVVRVSAGQGKRGCLFSVERTGDVTMGAVADCLDAVEREIRQ